MSITEKEKNKVFGMACRAMANRLRKLPSSGPIQQIEDQADGYLAEVKNILIEHITPDQAYDMAARELAHSIASELKTITMAIRACGMEMDFELLAKGMEQYSEHLDNQ